MKIIVVGDGHFCDHSPIKRLDIIRVMQLSKLSKIRSISIEKGVDAVVFLGDIFDKAKPDTSLVNQVIEEMVQFRCPLFSIVGNHCTQGCKDGVNGTAIGTLFASGVMEHLGELLFKGIQLIGYDHTNKHNLDMYRNFQASVIFTHNMVVPYEVPYDHMSAHDILKVIKNTVVFSGDFHLPFIKENDHSVVINPGVLVRTSIAEKDVDPSVILFEASGSSTYKFESISLGAVKGDDIFDLVRHEREKEEEINLKRFIDSIKSTQFQSQDIEALVTEVGNNSNIEKRIINEAINRIRSAKALN